MGLGISIRVGETQDQELSAASHVVVTERMGEPTRYSLRYPIDIGPEGEYPSLIDARIGPESELAVVCPIDEVNQFLVKGPVCGQNIRIVHGGGDSYVEVIGADMLIELDREVRTKIWTDVTAKDVVTQILGDYEMTPEVDDTPGMHTELTQELFQRDTDLKFIQRLAKRFGCLFWLTADDKGKHTAHFQRPRLDAPPEIILKMNTGTAELPHIAWLDLSWDVETPTQAVAAEIDVLDKSDMSGSVPRQPLPLLGALDVAAVAPTPRIAEVVTPVDDAGELTARAEAALIEASWFTRAKCQTSFKALGKLVRAHTVIGISGIGTRHSGAYWVAGVRHVIGPEGHMMELDLYRNAWSA